MATLFLEPGGDATFDGTLWAAFAGTIATDFVHGGHVKSIQPTSTNVARFDTASLTGRLSLYIRLVALPTNATANIVHLFRSGAGVGISIRLTSAGVLRLYDDAGGTQIGSNGSTLSTGVWYRLTFCWNITSTTVNEFRLYKNNVSDISVSNATISAATVASVRIGNRDGDATLDYRFSDIYIDDSSSASDIATDLWVTAKRPNANGTANNFSTQIGSGGSGYGTGHSPQVNERALSTTNGWSMVGAGSAVTEEYSVEGAATGDISISGLPIIDYMGWAYVSALVQETGSIVVGGASFAATIPTANTIILKAKSGTTYPAGGTDIGIVTDTSLTTVSLYECGLMFAYNPTLTGPAPYAGMNTSMQSNG